MRARVSVSARWWSTHIPVVVIKRGERLGIFTMVHISRAIAKLQRSHPQPRTISDVEDKIDKLWRNLSRSRYKHHPCRTQVVTELQEL